MLYYLEPNLVSRMIPSVGGKRYKSLLLLCLICFEPHGLSGLNVSCFHKNTRYSGTDRPGSTIKKIRTRGAKFCQAKCLKSKECEYFLYITSQHRMWFKRNECRLLRFGGDLQENKVGHISGPKRCLTSGLEEPQTDLKTRSTPKNNFHPDSGIVPKPKIDVADILKSTTSSVQGSLEHLATNEIDEDESKLQTIPDQAENASVITITNSESEVESITENVLSSVSSANDSRLPKENLDSFENPFNNEYDSDPKSDNQTEITFKNNQEIKS